VITNLEIIRKKKGLQQKELAKRTGFSTSYICRVERGDIISPSKHFKRKVAKKLNANIRTLFPDNV